jgi:hypothetical protein
MTMKGYADLADLPENKRIAIIAKCVADDRQTVAVALEDDEKKVSRYERKLHAARPGLLEIERVGGLVPNTVTLRIKPKVQNVAHN